MMDLRYTATSLVSFNDTSELYKGTHCLVYLVIYISWLFAVIGKKNFSLNQKFF